MRHSIRSWAKKYLRNTLPNTAMYLRVIRKTKSNSRLQLSVDKMMNYSFNFSFTPGKVMLKESYIKQMREIAPDEHSLTMTAVCGFIALLSFVGNLLLCVVILKRRSMLAKPYNVLIFNLAVTDMLTGEVFFAVPFFFPSTASNRSLRWNSCSCKRA